MNKKTYILIGIVTIIIVVGIALFVTANEATNEVDDSSTSLQSSSDTEALDPTTMEAESQPDSAEQIITSASNPYITLATYNSDPTELRDVNKVLFFHASWCSICKSIEDDIVSDPSQIPTGVVFIKTDFDSSIELRKKHGVVSQYTFVQIDNEENQIAKWSATSLDKAIAGIQT